MFLFTNTQTDTDTLIDTDTDMSMYLVLELASPLGCPLVARACMSYQNGWTADSNSSRGRSGWNANNAWNDSRSRGTQAWVANDGWVANEDDGWQGGWIANEDDGWQGTWVANDEEAGQDADTDATTAPDSGRDYSPTSSSMVSAWSNWSFGDKRHGHTTAVAGEGGQVLRAIATAVAGTGCKRTGYQPAPAPRHLSFLH